MHEASEEAPRLTRRGYDHLGSPSLLQCAPWEAFSKS
jgi:hypothetical protein